MKILLTIIGHVIISWCVYFVILPNATSKLNSNKKIIERKMWVSFVKKIIMKSFLIKMTAIAVLLPSSSCFSQFKNMKTESVKIYGNCGMCEKTIEKAGNRKKVASVDWNQETKMATIKYNSKKTNLDEILKRIAISGYDSDKFLAPEDAYNNLAACCKYNRGAKSSKIKDVENSAKTETGKEVEKSPETKVMEVNQLSAVYDTYFGVKDALIKSSSSESAAKATEMLTAIGKVQMDKLVNDVHLVWMKVVADLTKDAEGISKSKDLEKQRTLFISLSKNIYELMKISKQESVVYHQFCPMANDGKGANWLSKENTIKNPYYGATMLSCGKTVETLK